MKKKYIMLLGLVGVMAFQPMDAMRGLRWKDVTAVVGVCYDFYRYCNASEELEFVEFKDIPEDCHEDDVRPEFKKIERVVSNYVEQTIFPLENECVLRDCPCNTCEKYNNLWLQRFFVEHKELGKHFMNEHQRTDNNAWVKQFMDLHCGDKKIIDKYLSTGKIAIASPDVRKRFRMISRFFIWRFFRDIETIEKAIRGQDWLKYFIYDDSYAAGFMRSIVCNDRLMLQVFDKVRFGNTKEFIPALCDYWLKVGLLNQYASDLQVIRYNNYALRHGKEQITPELIEQYTNDSIALCENYRLNNKTGFKHLFTCAEIFNHKPVLQYLEKYASQKPRGFKKTMHYDALKNHNYTDALIFCPQE